MGIAKFHFPKFICTVQIIKRSQSAPYDYCIVNQHFIIKKMYKKSILMAK